jgi:hypothetical protein
MIVTVARPAMRPRTAADLPRPPTPEAAAGPLPGLLVSRAALQAAAPAGMLPARRADEVVKVPPELVALWTDRDVQAGLRRLAGDGVRQLSPVAGQVYDGAWLVIGAKPVIERWLDPRREDPVMLAIDTLKLLAGAGSFAADLVPALAAYKPHLRTIGFGCSIAGTVYKGRARLGTGEEQQLVDQVYATIVQKLAPSPAAFAHVLATAASRPPRGPA